MTFEQMIMAETFKVKENPIMDFYFLPADKELPAQYSDYKFYKSEIFMGKKWNCYIKQTVKGCFSDSYWKN